MKNPFRSDFNPFRRKGFFVFVHVPDRQRNGDGAEKSPTPCNGTKVLSWDKENSHTNE